MKWILIIALIHPTSPPMAVSDVATPFATEQECEDAAARAKAALSSPLVTVRTACVASSAK